MSQKTLSGNSMGVYPSYAQVSVNLDLADRIRSFALTRPLTVALLLALLVGLPTVCLPFFFDDHHHLTVCQGVTEEPEAASHLISRDKLGLVTLFAFQDGTPRAHREAVATGSVPWWTVQGLRINFWRPLTSYLALLDYSLFGEHPAPYHLHSLLWYLLFLSTWWRVLRRCGLPPSTVLLALVVCCVDESHVMPVSWVANRHALVSATFGLLGLEAYLRWCEAGRARFLALSVGWLTLALAGGESAWGVMAYVGAHALFHAEAKEPHATASPIRWSLRLKRLAPVAALGGVWAAMYTRHGFGAWGSGSYLHPLSAPGDYAQAAAPRLVVLLGDHFARVPADLWTFVPTARPWLVVAGLLVTAIMALWLKAALQSLEPGERATLRWMIPGSLLALLPALAAPPSSRLLLVPSLGGAVVLAVLIRSGWRASARRAKRPGPGRIARVAAVGLAVAHMAATPISWWVTTATLSKIGHKQTTLTHRTAALLKAHRAGNKHVVVLNAPDAGVGIYLPLRLRRRYRPFPRSWHNVSLAPHPLRLRRLDAKTLDITVQGGELLTTLGEKMARSPSLPLKAGDTVRTDAFTVRITATGRHGPTRFTLRFHRPLGDGSTLLLVWKKNQLQVMPPPPIGKSVEVGWSAGPLAFGL